MSDAENPPLRTCVYCNKAKEDKDFSEEHVIPVAVGGNLTPQNPFKLKDVCGFCNSVCGSYVDAPFIKSWYTQNDRWRSAYASVKLSDQTVLPMIFYGPIEGLSSGNRICDFWQGPAFDLIYHFHEPYPVEPQSHIAVGPHPKFKRTADKGFVFLFVRSNNPVWIPAILRSVGTQFQGATFYLGNEIPAIQSLFSKVPDDLLPLHSTLKAMQGTEHKILHVHNLYYADRFLAKVTLGLGALLLSPEFRQSDSAKLLREFLWSQDPAQRNSMPVIEKRPLDSSGLPGISWPNGHAFLLKPAQGKLVLRIRFYQLQEAQTVMSSEPGHWESKVPEEGLVYVISPGVQRWAGPINLSQFLEHRMNAKQDLVLKELEEEERSNPPPPFEI